MDVQEMKAGLGLLFALLLTAGDAVATPPSSSLDEIVAQQRELALDLDSGEVQLTPREIAQVRRAQAVVFDTTEGKASLDAQSIAEQIRMQNALEQIKAVVAGGRRARNDADTCWRERASGTKVMTTRCGTAREKEILREGGRDYLEKRRICVPPGCGS